MREIHLQFCSSKDVVEFERRHYVRKMDTVGTVNSKKIGEPRGHHGQQVHYLIWHQDTSGDWQNVGAISGGSAAFAVKARDAFFKINKENRVKVINGIIDNTLFRLELHEYNLATRIVSQWRRQVVKDWELLYDVKPYGFETFVLFEKIDNFSERAGSLYKADNWTPVGESVGSTKNHVGRGLTGGLSGKPFNREKVAPKLIFCKWIKPFTEPQVCEYKSSWKAETEEEKTIAKDRALRRKNRTKEALVEMEKLGIKTKFETSAENQQKG